MLRLYTRVVPVQSDFYESRAGLGPALLCFCGLLRGFAVFADQRRHY